MTQNPFLDLVLNFHNSLGRLRQCGRYSSCLLPFGSNYCIGSEDQLDIANILRTRDRFRKDLSRVLNHANWRSQCPNSLFAIFSYDQSIYHAVFGHRLRLGSVHSGYQALGSRDRGKMLESPNFDNLDYHERQ